MTSFLLLLGLGLTLIFFTCQTQDQKEGIKADQPQTIPSLAYGYSGSYSSQDANSETKPAPNWDSSTTDNIGIYAAIQTRDARYASLHAGIGAGGSPVDWYIWSFSNVHLYAEGLVKDFTNVQVDYRFFIDALGESEIDAIDVGVVTDNGVAQLIRIIDDVLEETYLDSIISFQDGALLNALNTGHYINQVQIHFTEHTGFGTNYIRIDYLRVGYSYTYGYKPGAPQSLVAQGETNQVRLTWVAPSSDGGAPITGYNIYRDGSYFTTVGNQLSYINTGLSSTPPATYIYAVAAINGAGEGPLSSTASASPIVIPTASGSLTRVESDLSIQLNWVAPTSNGNSPITKYNIYRGLTAGGSKTDIGDSYSLAFTDNSIQVGTRYYYTVTAVNGVGESTQSNEVNGVSTAEPYIFWDTPANESQVIFGMGNAIFNFSYTYSESFLTNVKLFLNDIDFGYVTDINSTVLTYSAQIDGLVNATLKGYNGANYLANDTRFFTFGKKILQVIEVEQSNTTYIGNKLYYILHDPSGDCSYSGFTQTSSASIGVGVSATVGGTKSVSAQVNPFLFGIGIGGSYDLTLAASVTESFNFRFEVTNTQSLRSNLESNNDDFIGPGRGDRYWGEGWTVRSELRGENITYFNGSSIFTPVFSYGIEREGELVLNDVNAPAEWKALNPVYHDYENVTWLSNLGVDGGSEYTNSHGVTTTGSLSTTFQLSLTESTRVKLGFVEALLQVTLSTSIYGDAAASQHIETYYSIYDNEATDHISQQIGIDNNFGTYIFRTYGMETQTSQPLENGTIDYIPPVFGTVQVKLDSNEDGESVCIDDSPFLSVQITDESPMQLAVLYYSINNGVNWLDAVMQELSEGSGTYFAVIPAQAAKTLVLYYLKAWDARGLSSTKFNPQGLPFSYTVRANTTGDPIPESTIDGYDLWAIFACFGVCGILLGRKLKKKVTRI